MDLKRYEGLKFWTTSVGSNRNCLTFRVQFIRVLSVRTARAPATKTMRIRRRWFHVTIVPQRRRLSVFFTLCEIAEPSVCSINEKSTSHATDSDYTCRFGSRRLVGMKGRINSIITAACFTRRLRDSFEFLSSTAAKHRKTAIQAKLQLIPTNRVRVLRD